MESFPGDAPDVLVDLKRYVGKKVATAKAQVRKEAAKGARDAVMPLVLLSIALSLYQLTRGRRRRG